MNYLNKIDAIYCINLASRKDRCSTMVKEFERVGINKVKRWEGVLNTNGHVWCFESHRGIYKEWLEKGFKKILIFEDDAHFISNLTAIETYLNDLEDTQYDIAYLGWTFGPISKINAKIGKYWYKVEGIWNCHAYIISEKYMREMERHVLINWWVGNFISKYRGFDRFIACYLSEKLVCLFPRKILCFQSPDYSDIDKTKKHFLNWWDNMKYIFIKILYSPVFQRIKITKLYEFAIKKIYKRF